MAEKDIIDVLRMYRHDLMNDLQIVQGYLTMGKTEKVQEKLAACMNHFDKERKLISLNAPKFALWLIQFNSIHATFRLTYDINTENKNFSAIDNILLGQCQYCMKVLEKAADATEVYEGNVNVDLHEQSVLVQIFMAGIFKKMENNETDLKQGQGVTIHMKRVDDGITCNIEIPFN
ncbi:Spo0B domain-containing protein [Virgibacillus ndiopensis]|uniref:Spo0B domain-containing protein n=1 Tax=Virgibacillus ndiopensis TaxID=2004408 RepID=UPI000C06992F|nr:Spo0B domain-containing protein [Virgibacillus ndiopensis]